MLLLIKRAMYYLYTYTLNIFSTSDKQDPPFIYICLHPDLSRFEGKKVYRFVY